MFYDKTWAQSYALPLLGLIPVFLSISTFVYDYYSDFELTFEYYQQWKNPEFAKISTSFISQEDLLLENPDCSNIQRTPEEYRTAFFVNIICICFPFLVFYLMGSRVLWQKFQRFEDNFSNHFAKIMLRIIYGFLTVIFAPFFILYVAVRQLIYKFQHLRATRKNKVRKQLQETEYLWGISRTAEAALESCGQLILQIWLLSSDFNR